MSENEIVETVELWNEAPVTVFVNVFVKLKNENRKNDNYGKNAEYNALRHNKTNILSERKIHKAESEEAEYRCQRAARKGDERTLNCACHCVTLVGITKLFLLESVDQENRIVHRDSELKNCGYTLGDVRDLPENHVGTHIVNYRHAQCRQQDERLYPRLHTERHYDEGKNNSHGDENRCLRIGKIHCVFHNDTHAAHKALLIEKTADILYCLHGLVRNGFVFILDKHHCAFAVLAVKDILDSLRKDLMRYAYVGNIVNPHNGAYIFNLCDFFFQGNNILGRHIFNHKERHRRTVKGFVKLLLTLYGIKLAGQVREYIVVDKGIDIADCTRNKEQDGYYGDQLWVICDEFRCLFHLFVILLSISAESSFPRLYFSRLQKESASSP